MKTAVKLIKIITVAALVFSVTVFSALIMAYGSTSEEYNVVGNNKLVINCDIPIVAKNIKNNNLDENSTADPVNYDVQLNLLGFIPLRKAKVNVVEEGVVYVLGKPFGMKVYTDGVLVVNISEVDTASGNKSPAKKAGLLIGDSIITINGQKVYTNEDVAAIIESSAGAELEIIIKRDGELKALHLIPELSKSTNVYKAGIWVRDSSAGIGTLTFYSPESKIVCGLGHSINDNDTGKILKISSGEVVEAEIISLTKASPGSPGELHGRLLNNRYGRMVKNCEMGVYAEAESNLEFGEAMPVAQKQEVQDGQAYIYTCIAGNSTKKFSCEIKVNKSGISNSDITVYVTDDQLISSTGGIVQGMSGSPIVQNGKLVGAVTHVLVDDPTKGYGIFAENMLKTANETEKQSSFNNAS